MMAIKKVVCGCFMAVVFSWLLVMLAIAESQTLDINPTALSCLTNCEIALEGRMMTTTARRLRAHLLLYADDIKRGRELLAEAMKEPDVSLDLKLQWVLLNAETNKQAKSELMRLMRQYHSPSTVIQCIEFREKGGSIKAGGRGLILKDEPYWLPALVGMFSKYLGGGWWAASDYGVNALNLLELNSPVAKRMFERMATSPIVKKVDDGRERARVTLEDFWKVSKGKDWQEQQVRRRRLEAGLLYHAGMLDEALKAYEEIVQKGEADGSAYYRLARLYESFGRQEEAEATIQAGLKKFPKKNSILLVTAAEYAAKRGEVDETISLLNKCLAGSPEYPPAHIMLAELEAERGNRDAAIKACADTLAFCYGWDGDFLDRVNGVLENLVQLQAEEKAVQK